MLDTLCNDLKEILCDLLTIYLKSFILKYAKRGKMTRWLSLNDISKISKIPKVISGIMDEKARKDGGKNFDCPLIFSENGSI